MATFPQLKTHAVAQYPATRSVQYQNQILRFVDGNEQRYQDTSGPLHQWVIRLDELDEGELAQVDVFFSGNQGQFGSFAFVDPWDGTAYPDCSLGGDELDLTSVDTMRGKTSVTVRENRS
jgi:hypothetical protein